MLDAPIPDNEAERLASLQRMNLLSTPREADFDRIVRLATRVFGAEMALVSLIDRDRQWFKACEGLDAVETPRNISFCGHAILQDDLLIVNDARTDLRFHDNPVVTGPPFVRFYAGRPLTNRDGFRIGTLCVVSSQPRDFDIADRQALNDLGRLAEIVIDNRRLSETEAGLVQSLAEASRDKLIDGLTGLWNRRGLEELLDREVARAGRLGTPLAVAMGDIDHFKRINDSFGHQVGDRAIKLAGNLLRESSRATDVVARFGGEEFVILAPDLHPANLPAFGGKVLQAVREGAALPTPGGDYRFTISLGMVAVEPDVGMTLEKEQLLAAADQALYAAKNAGRDRMEIAAPPV